MAGKTHFAGSVPIIETDRDGTLKTLKRAVFTGVSGDVVAAVAGKRIKVYALDIQAAADASSVQLTDGNGGSALTFAWAFNNREGVSVSPIKPPAYLFATTAGTSLYCVVTGTVKVEVSYWDDDSE